jgi:ubiquinol-cytochrome c reductase cytochrome b subunit
LALVVLALQIVTGIFLTMNYKPDAKLSLRSNTSCATCPGDG